MWWWIPQCDNGACVCSLQLMDKVNTDTEQASVMAETAAVSTHTHTHIHTHTCTQNDA